MTMNRRQFLGVTIASTVAAAALPRKGFIAWCREWLGIDKIRETARTTITTFAEMLKKLYPADILVPLYANDPVVAAIRGAEA